MHYLSNLDFVMKSDVRYLQREKDHIWDRIVDNMRLLAERDNHQVEGADYLTDQDIIWKTKKHGICAILRSLCDLVKEEKQSFYCIYWCLKTYGCICLEFKDLNEGHEAFRRVKNECEEKQMLTHKMITYKQLGYIYRLLKQHQKAIDCFKK